jgi:hypothetical protein
MKVTNFKYEELIPEDFSGIAVRPDGTKQWFENGLMHRDEKIGPAEEWADGTKQWRLNGLLHRVDGPAKELASGSKSWHLNGKCHREDGPAVDLVNGYKAWYLDDILYSELEWQKEMLARKFAAYAKGFWTMERPTKPGAYSVCEVGCGPDPDSVGHNHVDVVMKPDGELLFVKDWGGWWWSAPIPALPPPPQTVAIQTAAQESEE